MSMQQIMRRGHDFPKDKEGEIFNLWGKWGKAKCQRENPSNPQLPIFVFFPNHQILPECGWVSYYMEWEEYGEKFQIGKKTHFLKTCSDFLGKENVQKHMPFCYASTFFSFLTFWEQLEFFPVFFFPRFWLLASFFPWMGGRFCSAGDWVVFLTFLELLVHFSIHVFGSSMCFYHGCEEPFTFFTVSATIGLTHRLFGTFFPAESCAHW